MKKDISIQEIAAYTAGIVDGEGSIQIRCKDNSHANPLWTKKQYQGHITVTNTCYEVIEWLQQQFGGSISEHCKGKLSTKRAWRWYLCSKSQIETFIRIIFPYLIIRKERAVILLNFLSDDLGNNHEENYHKMTEANKKGEPFKQLEATVEVE